MLARNPDREWEKLGRDEPYYAVLSRERFRRDELNDNAIQEFFQSGEDHVRFVLGTIREYLDPDFAPGRALDFGCGVGRCSIPLAAACESVLGVDVSPSMLREAERKRAEFSTPNLELRLASEDSWGAMGTFDLIHSFLVFQHIHPARGEKILARLVGLLADGGVGALQFVYQRKISRTLRVLGWLRGKVPVLHNLVNLLLGKPLAEPLMEKHAYDVNRVFAVLHANRCGNVHAAFYTKGEFRCVVLFFQKKWDQVPHETV